MIRFLLNERDGCQLGAPLHTVTTKDRFGLVTVHGEDYRIVDIGMRMLTPRELFRAQGFTDAYTIEHGIDEDGEAIPLTKTAQVHMCGNSVCPPLAEALIAAGHVEYVGQQLGTTAAGRAFYAVVDSRATLAREEG